MIKRLLCIASLLLVLTSSSVMAQVIGTCGTMSEENREIITERLMRNKKMLKDGLVEQRNAITWVPVTFHLTADNDGEGRIPESNVRAMLCRMNEDYLPMEIQFFIHEGFNNIDNTNVYTGPGSFAGGLKMRAEYVDGTINIFICQNADTSGGIGTTLGYYSPSDDWLVLRKQEVSYGSATISHELGHYFDLLHTHNGWDSEPYNVNVHGNPVQTIAPGGIPSEKEARTGSCKNCLTGGDYLCDTPPDYNFGFGASGCNYASQTMDPCGDIVDPMETNYMGYFLECSEYEFTPDQIDVVHASLQYRMQTNSINTNFTPTTTTAITEQTTLEIPADGEVLAFKNVYFDWSAVDGAEGYVFEIDRFISFNVFAERYKITDGSSRLELELNPNTKYYWKITPYNSYSSCFGTTVVHSFTTGTAVGTTEIESVSTWSISPNPVSLGSTVQLNLDTNEAFQATIMVHNIAGQLIKEIRNQDFNIGNNNINLSIGDIENGTYLVTVQSENGIMNNKVVVAR